MKRNKKFIFLWLTWLLCITLAACSGLEEELSIAGKANENSSDTRADLIEYTISVETAGTLGSLVEAGNYSDAQKLIITGNIGYKDVNYVDVNMPTVEVLDLAGASYESKSISGAFLSDSTKIKEISLPGNITSIGNYAFSGCSSLTSITLPERLTSIGSSAFYGCSSLTSITLPESLTGIESSTFYGCSSLTSINIPENVTSIGSSTFSGCSSLTSISLPESLTSIGKYAFSGCSSLRIIKWNTSCSITDYFSLSGKLVLYETEDTTSTEGYDVTTAKQAIYTKSFSSNSVYGNRWYTISLPFKPTQITHETKGTIAPFNSGIDGAKNFWLRELTQDGYHNVTEIEAGHPYIIAMPTSDNYSKEFRLGGTVTFSAENVTLNWEPAVSEGPTYCMYSTYETVKKSKDVYALNSEYWVNGYDYGHVWVHSAMDVEPLQAYVKLNDGAATMRSVLPMADGKRTAVRGASTSGDASSRGAYGHQIPRKEDM